MKYLLVFFTLIISPNLCNSAWFKLFQISSGDLYIDTDSIVRDNNTIYFNQLVNYKNKQKNGMLSLKVFSEIDCTTLKIRDLDYEIFSSAMGGGEDFYNGKPKKKMEKARKRVKCSFSKQNFV